MLGLPSFTQSWVQKPILLLSAVRYLSHLGRLTAFEGSVKSYKRLGRGPASGKGKTSGRGQKGQKARGKVPHWLEGGQTPFYKRFPIIGFKRPHRKEFHDVNLDRIQDFWNNGRIPLKEGETLTIRVMRECGLLTGSLKDGVKLLGNGSETYNVPLNIEASKATASVMNTIENLGYTYTSVYHTSLGLQAHINPDLFLLRKGYVPLQARPTHKRDVAYYSSAEKRGYLLKDRALLLDHVGSSKTQKKADKKSELKKLLENASSKRHAYESKVVDLASL
ncbi:CIC11C00000003392 [Sungouiella intermedia]|uniref:CIC11C00000003392 n=1 Tax=Sungouiella intermedia TaxID=45354 RepID=A0A1L0C7X1_9ASCO|nr:CIC11C00000003392 [[Candida] intermedia]